MEKVDMVYGLGDIQNAIKRIGVNKSNVFCVGNDPLMQSGVIVSLGKVVSSKILDITIKSGKNNIVMSSTDPYLNKVLVKYINSDTKRIDVQTFNILNDDALLDIIGIIKKDKATQEKIENIEKNIAIFDEKLKKIELFLDLNRNQIGSIPHITNVVRELDDRLTLIQQHPVFKYH